MKTLVKNIYCTIIPGTFAITIYMLTHLVFTVAYVIGFLVSWSYRQGNRLPEDSSVQSLSRVWLCDPMNCNISGLPIHYQLPESIQIHIHWTGDVTQPSHPLSSPSPPAFKPSRHQGLFKWVSTLHQVAKVLEFQLQHQSGLISLKMDWLDLLAVQGTVKSLPQHHSSKARKEP